MPLSLTHQLLQVAKAIYRCRKTKLPQLTPIFLHLKTIYILSKIQTDEDLFFPEIIEEKIITFYLNVFNE